MLEGIKNKIKIQHEYFKKDRLLKFSKFKFTLLAGLMTAIAVVIIEYTNDNFITKAFARSIESDIIYTGDVIEKNNLTGEQKKEIKFYLNLTKNAEISVNIFKYSKIYNVNPDLMLAIMKTESQFRSYSVNYNYNQSVDRGLFQLNSNSFPHLKIDEFFDTAINIENGSKYLRWCIDQSGNNIVKTLAIYNAGIGKLYEGKIGKNTLEYIQKVLDELKYIEDQKNLFMKNQ
jgi:soluble lytic murein transglycosylase-like protein